MNAKSARNALLGLVGLALLWTGVAFGQTPRQTNTLQNAVEATELPVGDCPHCGYIHTP